VTLSDQGIVHVDLGRLDRLLNLVEELVITRTALVGHTRRGRARHGFKEQVLDLIENAEHIGRLSEEIQSRIIKARLVPVETLFQRFVGLIERVSQGGVKEIDLTFAGEKTEVDKRTIDELMEPLLHLVRNAIDHGIEPAQERARAGKPRRGAIALRAHHEGNRLVVEVEDDGHGVDLAVVRARAVERGLLDAAEAAALTDEAAVDLIFAPGFSTATSVTGTSGRGVGLDAARGRVEMLGGTLRMTATRGQGARSRIVLPLTTAIVEAMVVTVGDESYALPVEHVQEILRVGAGDLSTVEGQEVLELRGVAVPVLRLAELVELPGDAHEGRHAVVVSADGVSIALVVDRIVERHEIVIKGAGRRLAGIQGLAGASIDSEGSVVLVLDVGALCEVVSARRDRD